MFHVYNIHHKYSVTHHVYNDNQSEVSFDVIFVIKWKCY